MGRVDAAAGLTILLAANELPYRARWLPLGSAPRRGHPLNVTSVGRVIAAHLVNIDRLDETAELRWPRRHKDWLQRCLNTSREEQEHPLDRDSLSLFCEAFDMSPRHGAQLASLWAAAPGALRLDLPEKVLERSEPTLVWPGRRPPPYRYHTIIAREEHVLGPDRRPQLHRTSLTVQADIDSLDRVNYLFDHRQVVVEVADGASATGPIRRMGDGLWSQDIVFDRPLGRNEQRELNYTTYFHHSHQPPPEFRRFGSSNPDARIEVRVAFDADCLPETVRRCVWTGPEGPSLAEAVAFLDDENRSVWQVTKVQPGALIGFRWTWPD
ncbi:hypothetical protein BH18ACT7_BH18ACT7_04680 [soil metagenome]